MKGAPPKKGDFPLLQKQANSCPFTCSPDGQYLITGTQLREGSAVLKCVRANLDLKDSDASKPK